MANNTRVLGATPYVINAIKKAHAIPSRTLPNGKIEIIPQNKTVSGGGYVEKPYDGMFTCIDASYTDDGGTKHNDIVVTVGKDYVPRNGDTPDSYPTNAGVATVNGYSHSIPSVKFTDVSSSGYIYLHTTNSGSAGSIVMSGTSVSSSDSVVILGSVIYVAPSNGNDAYIIVRQVWQWEQIIDYIFATCEEITCG